MISFKEIQVVFLLNCMCKASLFPNSSVCFPGLDCFPMEYPWTSLQERPFPPPASPDVIQPVLKFYSRNNPVEPVLVETWPHIQMENIDFDPRRPYTIILTPGFISSPEDPPLLAIKDNYLKMRNANIFITDWRKGSYNINYGQSASNTRVLAAILARFLQHLITEKNLKPSQIHLIGHSLGAQTSGYIAKRIPRISLITALDPAQPGFETVPPNLRVDSSDAQFVEVVHVNCLPFMSGGLGMIRPVGHTDFYFNGGRLQPACTKTEKDLIHTLACSHYKALDYYAESILSDCFVGYKADNIDKEGPATVDEISKAAQTFQNLMSENGCNKESCSILGLNTWKFPARGKFAVYTNQDPPFCGDKAMPQKLMNLVMKF